MLAVIVVALAVSWALFVPTADWLASHDVGHVAGALRTLRLQMARDAARGRLLTFGAGLVALGALIFTALNFNLLRRNSEQADQWQRRTHELAEQGQVTDRYTRAIEQLGSDKGDVRIGGIYALERISRDSARDHPTVMEVLAALIREHSVRQPGPRTIPEVQAALTVIGRRDSTHDREPPDLSSAHLPLADLSRAELSRSNLYGATLDGADLTEAKLGSAILAGADLGGAHLGDADLTRAYLTHAKLNGTHLKGASLKEANLLGADLTGAELRDANLTSADLKDAILTNVDLTGADVTGARWPPNALVPAGWVRHPESGFLKRADPKPA